MVLRVLEIKDVERPVPNDNEVLINTRAASINSWDWDMLTGVPYEYRFLSGLFKPKATNILGCDIAGCVVSVGSKVNGLKSGDEVYGDLSHGSWGGFAEYVCAKEYEVRVKPDNMSFEDAASMPQAALLALQAFQAKKYFQPGESVLINGACGGVGTFAIQIAKTYGVEITAVDSTEKLDVMSELGADHVVDYTREDFTSNGKQYDFILDVKSSRPVFHYKRALKENGVYATVGGNTLSILQVALLGPLIKRKSSKELSLILHRPNEGLREIEGFYLCGKVVPVIDNCYTLDNIVEAFQ